MRRGAVWQARRSKRGGVNEGNRAHSQRRMAMQTERRTNTGRIHLGEQTARLVNGDSENWEMERNIRALLR